MNIFFGKIKKERKDQVAKLIYESDEGWDGFGGLNEGDYVFLLCDGKVHLWKAMNYDSALKARTFECVLESIGKQSFFFSHIKYFKLTMDLVVKSHRQTHQAFFKIDYEPEFTEEMLCNRDTYKADSGLFRRVFIRNSKATVEQNSYDVQLFFDEGNLKLAELKNSDGSFTDGFKDNLSYAGKGREKKDQTIAFVLDKTNQEKPFAYNSKLNASKIYDAFMVDYNAKEEAPVEDDELDFDELIVDNEAFDSQVNLLKYKQNVVLQGAPGTGKTYATAALALSIVSPTFKNFDNHQKVMAEYEKCLMKIDEDGYVSNDGQIAFVTFHQSMDYEDFVEGIKPICDEESDGETKISYQIQSGIFKAICHKAKTQESSNFESAYAELVKKLQEDGYVGYEKYLILDSGNEKSKSKFGISLNKKGNLTLWTGTKEDDLHHQGTLTRENMVRELSGETVFQSWKGYFQGVVKYLKKEYKLSSSKKTENKNYVLIIDEINRGNVSKIFGELISLLEADKRDGAEHPLKVTLPYSKEQFSVPSNLYIIGTMNTTDRSVGSIDYAVRRRFAFVTLKANEDAVDSYYNGNKNLGEIAKAKFNDVKNFLESPDVVAPDVDFDDLMVGHSYFMAKTEDELKMKWEYEVLPLLREYKKDGLLRRSASLKEFDDFNYHFQKKVVGKTPAEESR
ncbi:McrB family protein [Fibrobacter sp. UWEL]|uniref:McrB family protein n=1 Tax=Fibrobacter sp. UWEL TaxID=1896209 RepID=UPI0009215D60|nr:AAA family ATPase [Fibrobacter sp. UWEL]SHK79321.1 AAA domain (dynein-related subfamily) [Fibrobacter sp. UWEL]